MTYGIYGDALSEDEKTDWHTIKLGSVDDELKVVRFRLKRAMMAQKQYLEELDDEALDASTTKHALVVEVVDDEHTFDGVVTPTRKVTKRVPDFDAIIHRCIQRIESLEKTRRELGTSGEDDLRDSARKLLETARAMDDSVPDPDAPPAALEGPTTAEPE